MKQFNDKWNSVNPTGFVEFKNFVPLAGGVPINYKPANGALGVGTSVTLDWDGGNWNHRYDVYLGTDPNTLSRVGENLAGNPYTGNHETWALPAGLVAPGTTYYWRVVGKTMANLPKTGPTWSFTTAGSGSGSPPPAVPGLTATGTGPTQVSLAWTDVAGETQYVLERSPSSSTGFVQIATTGANVTRYADNGRAMGTTYYYRIRAGNANGYSAYSAVVSARTLAGPAAEDVALYAGQAPVLRGAWAVTPDNTAAGGVRLYNGDAGLAKVATPAANPVDYFEMTFNAQAGRAYRLWIRGKALNNAYTNDSVWVQFSDSVDASNAAAWRIGSTSGIALSVEECSGCGLSAWGWHDSGWGVGVRGTPVYFATSGTHTIRVQRREDGISLDQIVVSPATFFTSAPGTTKNDTTILPKSAGTP